MAHPLVWPGKYYFYPIGNTPAVCLARDLAPEEPANILLLGCGDPRNILYTIFCEPQNVSRTLDFTCCDVDPAVLARNVLLLTMAADKHSHTIIWNIFFHLYLDKDSHSILVEQCRKLIGLSDTLQHWNTSPYGSFIKMCTEYTLVELRRHWSLYIDMQDLPHERLRVIRDAFAKQSKSTLPKVVNSYSSARSAGPLMIKAIQVSQEQFKNYWVTGVTFSDPRQIAAATLLNPTFVYSLGGEGCWVHYGTDPLVPFHLADSFGNAKGSVAVAGVVKAAQTQFSKWCSAFHTRVSSDVYSTPVIRLFLGEATAVCRALRSFAMTKTLNLGVPVAQWKTQLIQLSRDEYVCGGAPVTFNVIDTSNLNDHMGPLNVLVAAVPLLSNTRSSVLYTESLLFRAEDATKEFADSLYADLTIIGLLLGLCPIDYLSGFTTRSNTHELMTYWFLKGHVAQFHQVTTWKSPTSGDTITVQEHQPPIFDPYQLGKLLYDMYHQMFEQEDAMHFLRLNQGNIQKAISTSNLIHYMRESFVLFLKLVRDRLGISEKGWLEVMDRFFNLEDTDQSLPMDSVNYQDLCAHLHGHGVYTVPIYHAKLPKIGRFKDWDTVPPLVRVILAVPRKKLVLLESAVEKLGTPLLQCDIRGSWSHNIFTAVHVAFGRVIPRGTKTHPWVVFEEDLKGLTGTSPLVASFTMPSRLLTDIETPENLNVCFSIRSTVATVAIFDSELGPYLTLFSAKLMDESHVYVLPEQPAPSIKPRASSPTPHGAAGLIAQIGGTGPALVALDDECELATSLTSRVSVEDEEVKRLFGSGAMPQIKQVSACVMRINVGRHTQDLVYPFPVIGSRNQLRLARKSLYIEVVVPVWGPLKSDGMKLNPFPVVGAERALSLWNIHYLNLSRLPILDITATDVEHWLNPHVGSAMSSRERSHRKKHKNDVLMFVKDTLHTIFVRSSGIQGGPAKRLFGLYDKATRIYDTVFFISDLRFDLSSHTMVCDGYVLPLTDELMSKISSSVAKLVQEGSMTHVSMLGGELRAWKQLLPAFAERCRTWKHGDNCEYKVQGKVPLAEVTGEDPLCSCGRGKDVEGMSKEGLSSKLGPYVTRIALSPLFAVSYLETVGRNPADRKCFVCQRRGQPKLMTCTVCRKVRYCSAACQKRDWKVHKTRCKP